MPDPTDITLASYENGVPAYFAGSPSSVDPAVASLLDALAQKVPGGSVLELGSGPGREAEYLEQHGLTVDRTDASLGFVEHLQSAGHAARVLDVRSGQLGGPVDAVLANAVLLHLDRGELARALQACRVATREGGFLVLTSCAPCSVRSFRRSVGPWPTSSSGSGRWSRSPVIKHHCTSTIAATKPSSSPHTFATVEQSPARVLVVMTPEIDRLIERLHAGGTADTAAVWAEHHSSVGGHEGG